jgi:hypothetical protein
MRAGRCSLALGLPGCRRTPLGTDGGGGLRGFVKDESGAVLPGVTVTATSPELITPSVVVSDETGLYRLNNLPPGNYVIQAELAGFATTRRENILVRAGQTFTLDIQLGLSTLAETITVPGESPMIESSKPTTSITLDREPIRARRSPPAASSATRWTWHRASRPATWTTAWAAARTTSRAR